jgi:hypothetical protein
MIMGNRSQTLMDVARNMPRDAYKKVLAVPQISGQHEW